MKKALRKLIPTLVMVMIAASMVGTSTFAWFSINNKVTVTGMEVTTKVSNNLLIADSLTATLTKEDDSAFKTNSTQHLNALLEPVSTVDGVTFFYNSTNNVAASGDAIADSYVSYDPADTGAFNTNYNTTGAVGYVDYAFQLKATNVDPTNDYYINVTKIDLLYAGTATTEKAFRVAIFVDDMGADGATNAVAPSTTTLKTILRHTGATYFSDEKAISGAAVAPTAVNANIDEAAVIATVQEHSTHFFKVVVRLWLEGEDTTCNNTTFADLKSSWALNLDIEFEATTTNAKAALNKANDDHTADLTSASLAGSGDKVIDGRTFKKIATVTLGAADLYVDAETLNSGALWGNSVIYTINGQYVTDVTNQCTLPAKYNVTVDAGTTGLTVSGSPFVKQATDTITVSGINSTNHKLTVTNGTATITADTITINTITGNMTITIEDVA